VIAIRLLSVHFVLRETFPLLLAMVTALTAHRADLGLSGIFVVLPEFITTVNGTGHLQTAARPIAH
jgi:hypothetical protein